jgi:tellurite resistance protein TehA-like permease
MKQKITAFDNRNVILRAAADLFPGYFALVMATGIISIACFLLEMKTLAIALLVINVIAYVVLWVFLLLSSTALFSRGKADINDHVRGPGFFTVVAGTCVLGSELIMSLAVLFGFVYSLLSSASRLRKV